LPPFTNLGRATLDAIIKKAILPLAEKLGDYFNLIDWEACGDISRLVSLIQWINLTKWVARWLPVAKNMCWWKFWGTDVCPCCRVYQEDMDHLFYCEDLGMQVI